MDGEKAPLRGYVIGFASTALWSASAVFISHLNSRFGMPPLVLAFWRDLLVTFAVAGTLAFVAPPLLRLSRPNLPFFILYGFVLAIFNSLWTVSVALNGAAVATVLIYISPAFTALIGWRWFGEQITPPKIVAIVLSLIGCVFASGAHDRSAWRVNTVGILVGLGTGLTFTIYSLLGRASSKKGVNPWTATLYTFAFGSTFLLLAQRPDTILWLSHPLASSPTGWREAALGWATMLMLAIGPTLGGYGLYTVSLVHLPATTANLIVTLEPALTAGLAYVFLGDHLTPPQFIGGLIILAAVFTLRITSRQS